MNKHTYEIEYKSETFRVYQVEAESADDAEVLAEDLLNSDWDASQSWRENATLNYVKRTETLELNPTAQLMQE